MKITYRYDGVEYSTEELAQAAATAKQGRLENNPTDWVCVKEITDNGEGGWVVHPNYLSDEQINNIDISSNYSLFCPTNGQTFMPLTAPEVTAKVLEFKHVYMQSRALNRIIEDDSSDPDVLSWEAISVSWADSVEHFARIESGLVSEVILAGQDYIDTLSETWVQTSYDTQGGVNLKGGTPLRKNYAGVGYTYDDILDVFYAPQPFPSWVLSTTSYIWEPPIDYPDSDVQHHWDEASVSWVAS